MAMDVMSRQMIAQRSTRAVWTSEYLRIRVIVDRVRARDLHMMGSRGLAFAMAGPERVMRRVGGRMRERYGCGMERL